MEAPEEFPLGSKEHTNIVKGKRTKRVRPQSPIPFSAAVNSSTGAGEGDREDCFIGNEDGNTNTNNNIMVVNKHDDQNNTITNTNYPTTSSAGKQGSTDEEEDMANCLILLAQGQSRESIKRAAAEEYGGMSYNKYSSRKFMEAARGGVGGNGRAGYYVYECKTCNRTFPSFQALGGHRASHKKPKAQAAAMAIGQDRKHQQTTLLSSDEEEFQFKNNKTGFHQLNNRRGNNYKSKVHECSVCGAEFSSGQALGGHMRRHWAPVGNNTALSLTQMAAEPQEEQPRKRRNMLSLDLDLNLPAPEDDQRESKFSFASKQQQQQQQQKEQQKGLVFSTPALVDCHY